IRASAGSGTASLLHELHGAFAQGDARATAALQNRIPWAVMPVGPVRLQGNDHGGPMSSPETIRRDLQVGGLTCASCVRRVEAALRGVPEVRDASVNLVTERAAVTWEPSVASVADLARAVEEAGYALEAGEEPHAPTEAEPAEGEEVRRLR